MLKKIIVYLLLVAFSFSFTEWIFANYSNNNYNSAYTQNNSSVIIYKNWVKINWKYYTKAEFEKLLQTAEKIPENNWWIQTRAAFLALPWVAPWSYYIAWLWTVVVESWKVFLVWTAVAVWSWVDTKIRNFFSEKAKKESYDKAKKEWNPTDNHSTKRSKKWDSNLPTKSDPYSSKDLIDWWKVKQRRYYDWNWNAQTDIDYFHTDDWTHVFPHRHDWINWVRSKNWY